MLIHTHTHTHTSIQVARDAPLAVDPFCDNSVTNSKYNVLNFVPKAIFEQFRRLANCYFAAMGGLMLLGTYSNVFQTPLTAFTTLFPLGIVITFSMMQEGYADVKRHRAGTYTSTGSSLASKVIHMYSSPIYIE